LDGGTSSAEYIISGISRHKTGAAVVSVFVILVLASAIFVVYRFTQTSSVQSPNVRSSPSLQMQPLTATGNILDAVISPDGKFLAYVQTDNGKQSLWTKQIATNSNVQIVAPSANSIGDMTFAPSGDYVYYIFGDRAIYRVPTLGGSAIRIADSDRSKPSISPDGNRMAFARYDPKTSESSILLVNSDGTGEQKLADRSGHEWFNQGVSWSSDGKWIVCAAGGDRIEPNETIAAVDAESGSIREITRQRWDAVRSPVWLNDMSGILIRATDKGKNTNQQIWKIAYPSGEAQQVTHDLDDYIDLSATSDSRSLVTIQHQFFSNIEVSPNSDISKAQQVSKGKDEGGLGISWTPDGKIVYGSTASGASEIWIMDRDGSNAKQLTNDGVSKYTPAASADGRYIVFVSEKHGRHLWRINVDGSQASELTSGIDDGNPRISPDSNWVVYSSSTSGTIAIWRVSINGGDPQKLMDLSATEPDVSPDGKLVSCFSLADEDASKFKIRVVTFYGGQTIKTFDVPQTAYVDMSPLWTSDGRGITYVDLHGSVSNLWLQPIDGSAAKQLTNYKQGLILRREWTRDGKQIAIVRSNETFDAVMVTGF
jgi:Tol biopolymer transport system component